MFRTVAQKMGLKEGMHAYFRNSPASALEAIHLPELKTRRTLRGEFYCLHLLFSNKALLS